MPLDQTSANVYIRGLRDKGCLRWKGLKRRDAGAEQQTIVRVQSAVLLSGDTPGDVLVRRALNYVAPFVVGNEQHVGGVTGSIRNVVQQIEQVSVITRAVGDLSHRSQLLALYAAIEAARAGELGRGFGIVADEVRKMAEQSKAATAEVHAILAGVTLAADRAMSEAEEGRLSVEVGVELARKAGGAISELTVELDETAGAAGELASPARRQHETVTLLSTVLDESTHGTGAVAQSAVKSLAATEQIGDIDLLCP